MIYLMEPRLCQVSGGRGGAEYLLHWRVAAHHCQAGNIPDIQTFLLSLQPLQVQNISLICCSIIIWMLGPPPPPSQPSRPGRTFTASRSWLMVTTSSSRPSRQCCSMSSPAGPAVTTGSHWPDSDRLFCRHPYTSRPATDRGRITL